MSHPLTPQAQERLERFKNFTIGHSVLTEIDTQLTQWIWEPGGFSHVLIYGPTGVGKTTFADRIAQRFAPAPSTTGRLPIPVVKVETPSPFSIAEWYANVLIALDERIIEERNYRDVQTARTGQGRGAKPVDESPALRRAVETALKARGVRAILFDEAQHFMGNETTTEIKHKWDWLKSLSNTTKVVHVLVGPYTLLKLRNVSGQASRRGTDLHFRRYHQGNEADRKEFAAALAALLAKAWEATAGKTPSKEQLRPLLEEWPFFYERSLGCIGNLMDWLIRAVSQTLFAGETALAMASIRQQALPVASCESMLIEIMAGEQQLKLEASKASQLRQMLGFTEEAPPAEEPPKMPKRTTRKPGTRNPKRDTVGEPPAVLD